MPTSKNQLESRLSTCADNIRDSVAQLQTYSNLENIIDMNKINFIGQQIVAGNLNSLAAKSAIDNTIKILNELKVLINHDERKKHLVIEIESIENTGVTKRMLKEERSEHRRLDRDPYNRRDPPNIGN